MFNEKFIQEFALEKFRELDVYTHLHHDRKTLDMFNLHTDKESYWI